MQKITILTVTCNQADKLEKLYKTLVMQKEYLKEWIVYDDASNDAEWLKKLEAPFPTKIIYGQKREKPLVVANMNECIRACDGLFMLVFADTYLKDDALKNLSETYISNSFGSAYKVNVNNSGKLISLHYHNLDFDKPFSVMHFRQPWKEFSGNGMIATKEIMERIGYIDEEYKGYGVDDYDTAMRAMMNGCLMYIYTNVKIYHIDHPTKETSRDNLERLRKKTEGEGYNL